jgi:transposase
MEGSIRLTAGERKVLLKIYRHGKDPQVCRRAHVLLLIAEGQSYRAIAQLLFASFDLIAAAVRCYRAGGVAAVAGETPPSGATVPLWLLQVMQWLTMRQPEDFGYLRRRWTCGMLREVLAWETGQQVSQETIRRGLKRMCYVWRRPRPVVGLEDPEHQQKLRRIQRLLARLSPCETALFQDEVDVHLNPKIGSCWMLRGQQSQVITPGNNEKRHLAGSLVWRTGTLIVSAPGRRRNAKFFLTHLDDLRRRLRGYRKIHVICDNARFHDCRAVQAYLARWHHRIELHFLPKYAPETNPIERVWWHLHETVTRNHRCLSMQQLLDDVLQWIDNHGAFAIESRLYRQAA